MKVVVHGRLAPYVDRIRPLLLRDEALHNLPLGVLGQIEQGVYDEFVLGAVEEDAEIVGMLLRTPPWPWTVASFSGDPDGLARVLGDHLARQGQLPGGVTAESRLAAAVAERWALAAGGVAEVAMAMRLMDCAELLPAEREVPGEPRPVGMADLDLVARWLVSFEEEAAPAPEPRPEAELRDLVASSIEAGRSPLWVWEHEGQAVSLAGIGRPTGTGERVGPVYTPPKLRGRGYAGALVARLTADAFDRGREHVFLFTDAANPISNRLYERLGYRHVGDAARYTVRLP